MASEIRRLLVALVLFALERMRFSHASEEQKTFFRDKMKHVLVAAVIFAVLSLLFAAVFFFFF